MNKGNNIPQQRQSNYSRAMGTLQNPNNGLWSVKLPRISAPEPRSTNALEGYLHLPHAHRRATTTKAAGKTAVILISDASGDTNGPSSIYTPLADKLAGLRAGMPVLRMGNRVPACKDSCTADMLAAIDYLQRRLAISRFILVGWNHGSAPVMAVGGLDDRVVGCATIASRTAESDVVERIAEKSLPILLLHGSSDEVIPHSCSERLLEHYRRHAKEDLGFLKVFDGDDHALTKSSAKAEAMLCAFVTRCAGFEFGRNDEATSFERRLVRRERVDLMVGAGECDGER